MTALTPRPGIMKIAPYVPGKDSVEGKQTIAKLSSNEGALGPSPKAMAAYAKAASELHRYPDGDTSKLRKAIGRHFGLDPAGQECLDVGASTGGFTEVLLKRGAAHVTAIDVGHDQMALELLDNPKVISMEGFNARDLSLETLAEASGISSDKIDIDLVVGDLSFISLTLVLEQVLSVAPKADYVLLIKPQFEVGKQSLHASGIVTDHRLRAGAIKQVVDCAHDLGIGVRGITRSELPGTHGNIEYVVWMSPLEPINRSKWTDRIEALAKEGK